MEFYNVQSSHSREERGIIKLQFLFLHLAMPEYMISSDTSDPSNRVILDTNPPVPDNNHTGLSADILADWAKRLSWPLTKNAMDCGLDPRMEAQINLLDRIPAI